MPTASSGFDGANANPISEGGVWDSGPEGWSAVQIVSNRIRAVTLGAPEPLCRRNSPLFGSDQFSQGTGIQITSANANYHVDTRITSSTVGDCYSLWSEVDNFRVYRCDGTTPTYTQLGADMTATNVTNVVLRLESVGSVHTCYRNGVSLGSRTDATYTGGQPGLGPFAAGSVANAEMDDWSGGDINPAGFPPLFRKRPNQSALVRM